MITFFGEEDLISFGEYLLSDERESSIKESEAHIKEVEFQLKQVSALDLITWYRMITKLNIENNDSRNN